MAPPVAVITLITAPIHSTAPKLTAPITAPRPVNTLTGFRAQSAGIVACTVAVSKLADEITAVSTAVAVLFCDAGTARVGTLNEEVRSGEGEGGRKEEGEENGWEEHYGG